MNWQHFQAFVWLRWRLLINQWRRAGAVNAVLMMIVSIAVLVTAIPLLIASFMLGTFLIPKAAPVHLLYAWDGLILAFLFFWTVGLMAELQRSEPLALSKFLHLPVSVNSAFLINYFSSLLRLSLIVFVPVMVGFCLALIYTKGILFLPVVLSLAAFLLMVTALTYQLQGWLAALMSNPRRRRTVIVGMTAGIVLLAQLPNLINFVSPWGIQRRADRSNALVREFDKLGARLNPGNSTPSSTCVAKRKPLRRTSLLDNRPTAKAWNVGSDRLGSPTWFCRSGGCRWVCCSRLRAMLCHQFWAYWE